LAIESKSWQAQPPRSFSTVALEPMSSEKGNDLWKKSTVAGTNLAMERL